jgi:hypothetical protein
MRLYTKFSQGGHDLIIRFHHDNVVDTVIVVAHSGSFLCTVDRCFVFWHARAKSTKLLDVSVGVDFKSIYG